jgi:hypothetical protein
VAENEGERQWIVAPPGRGEIALRIALGDGAHLTEDQEAALGALLESLETADAEVSGLASCTKNNTCTKLECSLADCTGLRCGTLETKLMGGGMTLMGSFGPA